MYDALVVANGDIPDYKLWQAIPYCKLICTDGAAKALQAHGLTPDIIIGDMDSLSHPQQQFPKSQIVQIAEQESTDFGKALKYLDENHFQKVLCIGALGKSADHAVNNLLLLSQCHSIEQIMLLHLYDNTQQWIFPLRAKTTIYTQIAEIFSILPVPQALITSSGLKWELNRTLLSQTGATSMRNQTITETVIIECQGTAVGFLTSKQPPNLSYAA